MRDILNTRFPTGLEADTYIKSALHHARVLVEHFCLSDDEGVRGAEEEELVTTLVTFGNPHAHDVIWIDDGEHGCEDMIFAAALRSALENMSYWSRLLGDDLCIRWIHNANPWGRSYYSRFTHEGGDANRSFRDTFPQKPLSKEYEVADECLNLKKVTFPQVLNSALRMRCIWKELGEHGVRKIIAEAQSYDPKRILWTGDSPFWSNRTIQHIISTYTPNIVGLDIGINCHTGLGSFGEAYFISIYSPKSEHYRKSKVLWGNSVASVHDPDCLSFAADGTVENAFNTLVREKQGRQYVGVCLEIGTWDMAKQVASVVLRHNVLQHNLPKNTALSCLSRKAIGWSYYPPIKKWRTAGVHAFLSTLKRTIENMHERRGELLCTHKVPI